jgi:hypothetical protein
LRSVVFCKYDSRQADRKTERLDTMKTYTHRYTDSQDSSRWKGDPLKEPEAENPATLPTKEIMVWSLGRNVVMSLLKGNRLNIMGFFL